MNGDISVLNPVIKAAGIQSRGQEGGLRIAAVKETGAGGTDEQPSQGK